MKERVEGRQRSLSFLPVFSCLKIPLIAGKALALCSGGPSWGARRTRDPTPPPLLFLAQTEARRAEKKMFWDWAPPYLWVWMTPPPLFILRSASATALSEQISSAFSLRLHWSKHSICSIDKCTFCLCYTYNTSLSLFFLSNRNGSLVISV